MWSRSRGGSGEGQVQGLYLFWWKTGCTTILMERSKNLTSSPRLSSPGTGRVATFLLSCLLGGGVPPREMFPAGWTSRCTKEKPFKAKTSLSQRQQSLFDLPMNQAGFALLNASWNSTSLQTGKDWIDARVGRFKKHVSLAREKLGILHGGKKPSCTHLRAL